MPSRGWALLMHHSLLVFVLRCCMRRQQDKLLPDVPVCVDRGNWRYIDEFKVAPQVVRSSWWATRLP